MEARRHTREYHERYAGRLPNFGVSLFAICNDPEPDELVSDSEENDAEKHKAVCRICLRSDKKLYPIPPQNRSTFKDVLNEDLKADNPIAQRVCFECNAMMTVYTTFRTRALQTNSLLYTIISPYATVNEPLYGPGNPRCIRHRPGSIQPPPTLKTKIFSPDHADYHFVYKQAPRPKQRNRSNPIQEITLPSLDLDDDDTHIFSEDNVVQEKSTIYNNIDKSEENLVQKQATIYSNIDDSKENLIQEKSTIYDEIESSEENLVQEIATKYNNKKYLVEESTKKVKKKKKVKPKIVKKIDKCCKPANEVLNKG